MRYSQQLRSFWGIFCFISLASSLVASEVREGVQEMSLSLKPAKSEVEILTELVNEYRQKHQRGSLINVADLNAASDELAEVMVKTGQFSHSAGGRSLTTRTRNAGYQWSALSENIYYMHGQNASPEQIARRALNSWINSPGHNVNLLGQRSTECGIAVKRNPVNHRIYVVMIYADPASSGLN